jgi:predicted  nucleic acid-binding Zn-ribbon protein
MIKRADPSSIAVADPENPQDLAEAVAQEQKRQRRDAVREDITTWRDIVQRLADGQKPTQAMLKQLGDLGHRLGMMPDAVSEAVRAINAERSIDQQITDAKDRLKDLSTRDKELRQQLHEARQQVIKLEAEVGDYARVSSIVPALTMQRHDTHARAPLMFLPIEQCIENLLSREQAMGSSVFQSLQPKVWRAEGHITARG